MDTRERVRVRRARVGEGVLCEVGGGAEEREDGGAGVEGG